jgi:undecaprenyl-diphosphatase
MQLDLTLFDFINGWAGRWEWLDAAGRTLAVFGVLAVLLLVQALAWWPRRDGASRRGYAGALLLAAGVCLALMAVEWWWNPHLRGRPAVGRWTTLLVTPDSTLAFPAWPVVLAAALAVLTWARARAWGGVVWALTALIAVAHVFTGINFPFDVLTGALLGAAIGVTVLQIVYRTRRPGLLIVLWVVLAAWGSVMMLTMRPASTGAEEGIHSARSASDVMVDAPPKVAAALRNLTPAGAAVDAAHNGHLTAVAVTLTAPSSTPPLREVTDLARRAMNAVYAGWPQAGYCTVTVQAVFAGGKTGTLYTVSVARAAVPAGGFPRGTALPGPKFYHAQYLAPARR